MCAFLVEQFLFSGLAWLSFMKKKVELSRNSYLESEIHVCLYKLVVVNTFNGFSIYQTSQMFHIFEAKKTLFFFKLPPIAQEKFLLVFSKFMCPFVLSFTSVLPDIRKKINKLSQKPPVLVDFWKNSYDLVKTSAMMFKCH